MSAGQEHEGVSQQLVRRGSLLRTEAVRLGSRRLIQVLLALGVLVFCAGLVLAVTQHAKPTAAGLVDAEQRRQQFAIEEERFRVDCLSDVGTPDGPTEADCGPPRTPESLGSVEDFVAKGPFTLDGAGSAGVIAIAVATAVLAYLLGATYVGAEWSTRSMVALLFWEPRRARVMAAKVTTLAVATALLAVLAEGTWLIAARVLAATRGTATGAEGVWGELFASAGRGVLFVVLIGLLGFGLANLVRNTGGALGFGFVYFAVLESVVGGLRPGWQQWLVATNAAALITPGGLPLYPDEALPDDQGGYSSTGQEVVSNLHGGLVLTGATAVLITLGVVLFARRDLH